MYLVVSRWNLKPGGREEFESRGRAVRNVLRSLPGIVLTETLMSDEGDHGLAIIGYADEATYQNLIHDPAGPFARALAEHRLEEFGEWVWSERGVAVQD
ncbi:MAG TPA: hypothetical protein PLH94_04035 [Fimbriimonadaceae bacterium]|nr:hypothetical protein [Fimbriimonadaceae bacterium]